jgi:glycine betaine/choline ABC-type transport system substrate-binding protein
VARSATLLAHPELRGVLQLLSGRISASDMRRMNYAVDVERQDAAAVAAGFLGKL